MVKRYVHGCTGLLPRDGGEWCAFSDYAEVQQERDIIRDNNDKLGDDNRALRARLAEAERLLREIADDQDDRVSPGLRIAAQQFLAAVSASGGE